MKVIDKNILKNTYGIALNEGNYKIIVNGNNYDIYTIKDDTQGCVLVGEKNGPGTAVLNSRKTMDALMTMMKNDKDVELEIL